MNLIQDIKAPTPFWAKFSGITLAGVFAVIVSLQQSNTIDILPIDPALKTKIQGIVVLIVTIGTTIFAAQKKPVVPEIHM